MSFIKGIQTSVANFPDKLETPPTPRKNPDVTAVPYPQNGEWLNSINEKVAAQITTRTNEPPDESFWVKLPADYSPETIRENLLRDEFGFTTEDIREFDRRTDNKGFLISEAKTPDSRATAKEVKGWEIKDGYVKIDVVGERAEVLRDFRINRVVDKSLENITDPLLRETVKADLMKIYKAGGLEKTSAAERLMNLEVENHDDAATIQNAVRTLAQQKESKNNAVIQVVAVNADLRKAMNNRQNAFNAMVNSPGNYEKNAEYLKHQKKFVEYENLLQRTMDAAAGIDAGTGQRSIKLNRAEAAWVNKELADVFKQMDEPERAIEREMVTRYYTLDEKDKNTLEFKLGKPRVGMDGTVYGGGFFNKYKTDVMSARQADIIVNSEKIYLSNAPSNTDNRQAPQKEFGEDPFKRETTPTEKRYKVFEQRFNGRNVQVNIKQGKLLGYEENYKIEGSLRTEGKVTKEWSEYKSESGKTFPKGVTTSRKTSITETQRGPELNSRGILRAGGANAAAVAADSFNVWFPIVVDVLITDKSRIARLKQEKTDTAIFFRDNYPVPPEPKDLPRIKLRLERELGKEKAAIVMKKLEEISYAAYGK